MAFFIEYTQVEQEHKQHYHSKTRNNTRVINQVIGHWIFIRSLLSDYGSAKLSIEFSQIQTENSPSLIHSGSGMYQQVQPV
jgi:hypothetical protein